MVLGAAGAGALQMLKLYEARGTLSPEDFRDQISSPIVWLGIACMLLASGFISWAYHAENQDARIWDIVFTGIAARSIVGGALAGKRANSQTTLGDSGHLKRLHGSIL